MPVLVTCECGTSYELRDEFSGKLVKCPQCGRSARAPSAVPSTQPQADPAFDRDIFLLRQQMLKISEKYDVGDEQGNKIVYVERPAHFLRNFGALLAAATIWFGGIYVMIAITETMAPASTERGVLSLIGLLVVLIGAPAVGIALSAKRHVTFYRDASKREKLLDIFQDKKWQPITSTFTIRDARGRPLARLAKKWLYNLFRKRWYVQEPGGARRVLYVAKEDSMILSLLRRFLGPLFGLLRTNFIILPVGTEDVIGEFKRKFTILDRYVLDMTADPQRMLDRRVALALGVMLDTGERR